MKVIEVPAVVYAGEAYFQRLGFSYSLETSQENTRWKLGGEECSVVLWYCESVFRS